MILKQLYTFGSFENTDTGIVFSVKNRLSDASLNEFIALKIDGKDIPLSNIKLSSTDGTIAASDISPSNSIDFPLRKMIDIHAETDKLPEGKYEIEVTIKAKPLAN